MKIYTKAGDHGETSLVSGEKLPKHHQRIETYGTVDELNSLLGVVRSLLNADGNTLPAHHHAERLHELATVLEEIQNDLFKMGSLLACASATKRQNLPPITSANITRLEKTIDEFQTVLPPLTAFILPGGCRLASEIHVARAVCRRTERRVSRLLAEEKNADDPISLIYLNRLSDFLFVAARLANFICGLQDELWKK